MSSSKSGSFVLRAALYRGLNTAQPNPNPQLFSNVEFIEQPIKLRGTYKLKFKYINAFFNKASTNSANPTFPGDNGFAPCVYFVSPQIMNYATNDNFVALTNTTGSSITNTLLGGNLDHEVYAQIDGTFRYNLIMCNPYFGNDPTKTLYPFDTYQLGMSPTPGFQPYFVTVPTFVTSLVYVDWEAL
jgi:hypothetical protein